MEDREFIIHFLITLITLVCFLLSTVFMTSLYNIRSQAKLIGIISTGDDLIDYLYDNYFGDKYDSYENSYTAIATLFSFSFLDFLGFMITLLIKINQYKLKKLNRERYEQESPNIQNIVANPESEERINYNPQFANNNLSNEEKASSDKNGKAMTAFFFIGEVIYLIEIIVLTVYHSKSSSLEDDLKADGKDGEYFTRIYRDLIIVGYIFLFIFIVFDLFTLVIACNAGERERRQKINNVESGESIKIVENEVQAKKEQKNDIAENKTENTVKQKDENENNDDRYCEFFSNCIIGCCERMAEAFLNCQREDQKNKKYFEKEIIKLDKNIEDLEQYLKDLNDLNSKIEKKQKLNGNEMEKLHLPRCDDTIRTRNDRINITSRNNK